MGTKKVNISARKPRGKVVVKNTKGVKNIQIKNQKQIIVLSAVLLLVIVVAVLLYNMFLSNSFKSYKIAMDWYGFNIMYNNKKANSLQRVTKSEAIKVLTSVITNKKSEDKINVELVNTQQYANEIWVEYAQKYGADIECDAQNEKNSITKFEAIILATKEVSTFLQIDIPNDIELKFKNISTFGDEEKIWIAKAVNIGLMENNTKNIDIKTIAKKGDINKIAITILEKYATVYYKTLFNKYEANTTHAAIVTDSASLPSNYEIYPYVINTIDKEIYEIPMTIQMEEMKATPIEAYQKRGDGYAITANNIEQYLDTILNVDYTTINKTNILNKLKDYVTFDISTNDAEIQEYVKYVVENKIKLIGKANVLLPILYNDGITYKLRVKVEFEIVNSNTDTNLLLGDTNIKYTGNKFTTYLDIPVGIVYGSDGLRMYNLTSVMSYIVKDNANIEVAK